MTDYRKDFPLLSEIGENTVDGREWIYIDNAATSHRRTPFPSYTMNNTDKRIPKS